MTSRSPSVRQRAPLLLSSTQWAQKEALAHVSAIYEEHFASLTLEQKKRYPELFKRCEQSQKDLDQELTRLKDTFKTTHLAQLKRELKKLLGVDIDPEKARIYTRYHENVEEDFVEYLARIGGHQSAAQESKFTFAPPRTKRAVDESRFKEHVKSVSLWDAACENFSYRTDSVLLKPFSYEQASRIDYNSDLKGQPAGPFIAIVRQLDLGTQLHAALDEAVGTHGSLALRTQVAVRASFEFELLEALRNGWYAKIFQREYGKLAAMLKGDRAPHIWPVSMSASKKSRLLYGQIYGQPGENENRSLLFGPTVEIFDHVGTGEVPLPLFIIKVEDERGVFSYFPQRLGGALRWHQDVSSAFTQFRDQLKSDYGKGQLGWFMRQLGLKDLGYFSQLLSKEPRPKGLTWLASILYDGFKGVFPEPDLDSLQLYVEEYESDSLPIVQAITQRHLERYRSNLSQLATPKSVRDWQAFKEALSDLGNEVLALLTTPLPGGVLGLNTIMQVAVFGSLAYSIVQGMKEALKGESTTFASAMADTADLLINARLIGVAAKVHRQRMRKLWNTLGQPRKITKVDGTPELWNPQLTAYPHLAAAALDNLTPNSEGLYELAGKVYAKVHEGDQTVAVEVTYDPKAQHYALKADNAQAFTPAVKYDPVHQEWHLALDDVQALGDAQLLQRMLPGDLADVAQGRIERMLDITGTPREQLLNVWQGELISGPLADGVRRLHADQLIDRIINELPLRGEMPANADGAVLALLTQLPDWPADTVLDVFNQQGQLVETYGKDPQAGTFQSHVELKRLDHGTYVARHDATQGSAQVEQMFSLILDQLPAASPLGRNANPDISKTGRIASVREQIANRASGDKGLLFKALTALEGHKRSDPEASSDPAKQYLPLVCPPLSESTTALLAKLHELNPALSIESLETLLVDHPFNTYAVTRALEHNAQPLAFDYAAERLKTKLRVDQALDTLYHRRAFNPDGDLWAREFARGLLHDKLDRRLVVVDATRTPSLPAPVASGSNDTTVVLTHLGHGVYQATDLRSGESVTYSQTPDSFFLALRHFLSHEERQTVGGTDAGIDGLRQTLGDAMRANRQANGEVNLWDTTTAQYERRVSLDRNQPPGELGLYEIQGKAYVALHGAVYQVEFDRVIHKWRMVHPDKPGVNSPILEHNYKGAWRQQTERPQQWDGLKLLRRLRAQRFTFSDEVGRQIMTVSNTDEGVLRRVHMNNLAPPPLLMDTWKRFKIEDDINDFVKKMQAHHTLSEANGDFQLLLIQSLPGWPRDKVLQITDAQGAVIKEYGADLDSALGRIRISIEASRHGRFLRTLLMNLNEADTRALLGEYNPIIENWMLALAKKIAAHALKREANLFRSIYENQEHSADPHVQLVQKQHPQLPKSVIEHVVLHASRHERIHYLDKGLVPPRVTEQLQWTAREVRLARAYEGLYLNATATQDSEKLTLHLLKSLPGWPGEVSIEVRDASVTGKVLDRIGADDAPAPRVLVLRDGRYRAWSREGQPVNPESVNGNNLLSSILHALEPTERAAIGVKDVSDTQSLNQKIQALAIAHRSNLKKLLGLEPPAPPRKPPMNVDREFTVYPLTVTLDNATHPLSLIREARDLYPSMDYEDTIDFLDTLGATPAEREAALVQRRTQFQMLQGELRAWEQAQLYPLGENPAGVAAPGHRAQARERIESAWRRESDLSVMEDTGDIVGFELDLSGLDIGDLPAISGDFSHVGALLMEGMNLRSGSNEFLASFTHLRLLDMSNNQIDRLPPAIAEMSQLISLELMDNRITLTPETAQQLANLSNLRALSLSGNPLGISPDVSQMLDLHSLDLSNTGISQWPNGLWALPHIDWANLRDNMMTTIPDAVFEPQWTVGANQATSISGNPMDAPTRERLIAYWAQGHSDFGFGPTFAHGINQMTLNAQAQTAANDVSPWLPSDASPAQTAARTQQWQLLQGAGDNVNDFFQTLVLFAHDRHKMSEQVWANLKNRVWTLIDQMLANTALRETLLNRIFREERSCGDGAMVLLENMEVEVLVHEALNRAGDAQREAELFNLAKRLFRLRQVDLLSEAEVARRVAAGGNPDAAEVILFYRVELAQSLDLPTQARTMLYAPTAGVSPGQIAAARASILALDGSPTFMHAITHEKFWRTFLLNNYADRFATIEADYQRDYTKLSEESGLSDEVELQRGSELTLARDQQVNLLIEELTLNVYNSAT
ncbi:NEL-type E3 ubiquitin ligase domain-containing protein [Pseudomonas sp. PS01297]|uniref:NEL-type E3 ubiquitin ligase domain-containing protein n=1 Tax=Pseudomonas sp. PS01297 TaxID=2991433 RepID=UPI00249AC9AC|nr:NEL-type E3 ubiquitin ligase domain-containing protein [Pseudomonas sp. PS01297]